MTHLLDVPIDRLREWFEHHKLPVYHAAQVRRWLYEKRASCWEDMTDLSKELRCELARQFQLWTTSVVHHRRASDDTEKLLLKLSDSRQVECVLLRDTVRRTACISTQVGCGMGCTFCASGLEGLERNLTHGEIIEQMLRMQLLLSDQERLSHVVVMGMGEPLTNVDALLSALAEASSPSGLGISPRRITISTVGLPQAMRRLTEEAPRYRLAVSLHAPNDQLRSRIIPTNKRIGLAAILSEADRYFHASRRQLTFEYVLLAGINDQPEHARQLARLLGSRTALLNVIPYNPVAGLPYRTPSRQVQSRFREILLQNGVSVKFRHRKGDKIDAACGQLRRQAANTGSTGPRPV